MEFISELSSVNLTSDHIDPADSDALLTCPVTIPVQPSHSSAPPYSLQMSDPCILLSPPSSSVPTSLSTCDVDSPSCDNISFPGPRDPIALVSSSSSSAPMAGRGLSMDVSHPTSLSSGSVPIVAVPSRDGFVSDLILAKLSASDGPRDESQSGFSGHPNSNSMPIPFRACLGPLKHTFPPPIGSLATNGTRCFSDILPFSSLNSSLGLPARTSLTSIPVSHETPPSPSAVVPTSGFTKTCFENRVVAPEPVPSASVECTAARATPASLELPFMNLRDTQADFTLSDCVVASGPCTTIFESLSSSLPEFPGSDAPLACLGFSAGEHLGSARSYRPALPSSLEAFPSLNKRFASASAGLTAVPVSVSSLDFASPPGPYIFLPSSPTSVPTRNASTNLISPPVPLDLSLSGGRTVLDSSPTLPLCHSVPPAWPYTALKPPSFDAVPSHDLARFPPECVPSSRCTVRFWDLPSSGASLTSGISLSAYFDRSRSPFGGNNSARKRLAESGSDLKDSRRKGLNGSTEQLKDVAELESMLEAQRKMLLWQICEIQRITTLQCELMGTNPLSEELVFQILGVKGGKKTGDSLSLESSRCLQEIFAIKDTITKKEARDISLNSGASLTQVRDFFAARRSLMRKVFQQAHDEIERSGMNIMSGQSQQISSNTTEEVQRDPGFNKLCGVDSMEKLVDSMRAEKSFAGQTQLLQVILHTESTLLIQRRFLEKGGLKVLGGWLVEAAAEEQTSVVCHLLRVLDHLPMRLAVPPQMPPLVQSVNKLRFYHASDVAGQARSLLTKWSKMFLPKTEGIKCGSSSGTKFASEIETGPVTPAGSKRNWDPTGAQLGPGPMKRRVRAEMLQHEVKASTMVIPVSSSPNVMPSGVSEYPPSSHLSVSIPPPTKPRWSSTLQPSESAVAAVSVSRKRLASKSLTDQSKDRHKVVLVEDTPTGKSILPGGSKHLNSLKNSRPLSTDDIYKAKKLQRLMLEPVSKSRGRSIATDKPCEAQGITSGTSVFKRSISACEDKNAVKIAAPWTKTLEQRNMRKEESTSVITLEGTRTQEQLDNKVTLTPALAQELSRRVITPVLQELSLQATTTSDMSETTIHRPDPVLVTMEDKNVGVSLASSGERVLVTMAHGVDSKIPADPTVSVMLSPLLPSLLMSDELSDAGCSWQEGQSESLRKKLGSVENLMISEGSRQHDVEDICAPTTSRNSSGAGFAELSSVFITSGVTNLGDKSALVVSRSKDGSSKGQELENISHTDFLARETSLMDFYAVLRASMIRWKIPPEYHPDSHWNVAAGEDSKEKEVQSGRVKREEEVYYQDISLIPLDPKDPWEEEPNYDDSLTLEILVDGGQSRELLGGSNPSDKSRFSTSNVAPSGIGGSYGSDLLTNIKRDTATSHSQDLSGDLLSKSSNADGLCPVARQLSVTSGGGHDSRSHDPDLLALLLRNPELVNQLTSGQMFAFTGIASQPVSRSQLDPLKQINSGGNGVVGLHTAGGDLGEGRSATTNTSKALGIPGQPERSLSSLSQMPAQTFRIQDSVASVAHSEMEGQTALGFVSQGGMDGKFLTPLVAPVVGRHIQDASVWRQLQVPPAPLPLVQTVVNQVVRTPLQGQPNKHSNWFERHSWVGVGRPPASSSQAHHVLGQVHIRPHTLEAHGLPGYDGMIGLPQVVVGPLTSLFSQHENHYAHRSRSDGSRPSPLHENLPFRASPELGVRSSRWSSRPPLLPGHYETSGGRREYSRGVLNGGQSNALENRPIWVRNESPRPGHVLSSSQYPLAQWQTNDPNEGSRQASMVPPFPGARESRASQQFWQNSLGTSRQVWRGM